MTPELQKSLLAAASYLIGSFPSGYILFRAGGKKDIRSFGSGATGATNMLRLKGWRSAIPVALIDIAKGFVPAFAAARMFSDPAFSAVCASAAVVGHCFPVYIGFKGGKGVATAAGAMFALAPVPALGSLAVFILTVALTRFVSLGSILAVLLFPVFVVVFRMTGPLLPWTLPIILVIGLRHAGNIGRLLRGTERKLGRRTAVES
jgi:glycerol-3-phosphate acyltransferase PlsY